jgi:hypothetical protein
LWEYSVDPDDAPGDLTGTLADLLLSLPDEEAADAA